MIGQEQEPEADLRDDEGLREREHVTDRTTRCAPRAVDHERRDGAETADDDDRDRDDVVRG